MSEGRGRRGTTAPLRSIDAAPVSASVREPGGQVALAKASSALYVLPGQTRSGLSRIMTDDSTFRRGV